MPLVQRNRLHQRALGVDIGSQVVKYLMIDRLADRLDIQAAGSLLLAPGLVESGKVADPKRFGKTVRMHLAEHGITGQDTVVSIPSNLAVLRWLSMPPLDPDEMRDAARFKVKRHLPFPVEDAYVEASPAGELDEDGLCQTLVIAVRRAVVDSRAEALEFAGLNPVGAELEAQAILRVAERRRSHQSVLRRDASLTIIDVGATNTHMYVVQNQKLQFIRGVKFGASRISETVSEALGLSQAEGEALLGRNDSVLTTEGILHITLEGRPACMNIRPAIEKLTREFLRLLRYFRSLHPERSYSGILDHVLICGGLASLNGFAEYLEKDLGLRVERARPFFGTIAKFNTDSFESIVGRQEAYTVVMGLAISGLGKQSEKGDHSAGHEFAWSRVA